MPLTASTIGAIQTTPRSHSYHLFCRSSATHEVVKEEHWFAPHCGTRKKALALRFAMKAKLPACFAMLLVPRRGSLLQQTSVEFDGSRVRVGYVDGAERAITG